MRIVETTIATVLGLIALFLVLNNSDKVATIMKSLGTSFNPAIRTLQGQ